MLHKLTASQAALQRISSAIYEAKITVARKELDERYAVILEELEVTGLAGEFVQSDNGAVAFRTKESKPEESLPEAPPSKG